MHKILRRHDFPLAPNALFLVILQMSLGIGKTRLKQDNVNRVLREALLRLT